MRLTRGAVVLCSSLALTALAQEATPRPTYQAVRAAAAPVVDGDLTDAAWQSAPEITGFTQGTNPFTRQPKQFPLHRLKGESVDLSDRY